MGDGKFLLWLLGPTSSGKTTLAANVVNRLSHCNVPSIHFDGDEVRDFFGPDHGFAPEDRLRVVQTLVHLANKSADAGLNVVVSALTAYEGARQYVREYAENLIICYVQCAVETCAERDPKGLYRQAKHGEIDTLAGYNNVYAPPTEPHLTVSTENSSVDEVTDLIMDYLITRGHISHGE